MNAPFPAESVRRVLIAVPNWVGDVVLATPALAALRRHFADARITYLMRRYVAEVVDGAGWHDSAVHWPNRGGIVSEAQMFKLAGRLRSERFDLAVLLTNSFRSAFVAMLARIPRRVGYARDARGWMLTDKLRPLKEDGEYVPASVLPYYLKIAEHVGCEVTDRSVRLGVTPEQERAGAELRRHHGLDDGRAYTIINPGAAFGAAKCWPADRFAALCDRLHGELMLNSVIVGAPNEVPLMREIAERAHSEPICCADPGTSLGSLKPLVRGAALVVCNDTGPRHYGIAFGIPTVTIFGPTDQRWTDTGYDGEIKIQVPVECGPCQLRVCPVDHRCMTGVSVDRVMDAARQLLDRRAGSTPTVAQADL